MQIGKVSVGGRRDMPFGIPMSQQDKGESASICMYGWMDRWIDDAILRSFQQYFSNTRTMGG